MNHPDWFYSAEQFQAFFKHSPQSLILKANPPYFTVLAVSDTYLNITHKQRSEVLNKHLFEVFPGSQADPTEQFSVFSSFQRVIDTKALDVLPVFKYEIFVPETGKMETQHWSNLNEPILDSEGNVAYLINTTSNITEWLLNQQALENAKAQKAALDKEQALNEQLAATNEELNASNEELRQTQQRLHKLNSELEGRVIRRTKKLSDSEARIRYMLADAPVAIAVLTRRDLIIENANKKILQYWGKTEAIIGQPLAVALPELQGQPFLQILDDVYISGIAYHSHEIPAMLENNGFFKKFYFDYLYQPVQHESGTTDSIFVVATDLTEQVIARQKVEQAEENLRIATESADLGIWNVNLITGQLYFSERGRNFYGLPVEGDLLLDDVLHTIEPDYVPLVKEALQNAAQHRLPVDLPYPIRQPATHERRWIRLIGKTIEDADGTSSQMFGVVMDITEQKKDEQRKNDFIGMVSHELKTPLTSLSGYIQILYSRAQKREDSFATGALDKAYKQVKRMTTMINGFLNLSRLESGKIQIDKKVFLLHELVQEVIEEASFIQPRHIINYKPCNPIEVNADRDKISNVISNLLSNAIKYSSEGRTIEVKCEIAGGMAQVSIQDEGIGIRPEDVDRLFERYYRVEGDKTISGFGIGLYLSAEIIQRHNGKIWVESELGKGSTFFFSLPLE